MTTQAVYITTPSGHDLVFKDSAAAERYVERFGISTQIHCLSAPPDHPLLEDALVIWREVVDMEPDERITAAINRLIARARTQRNLIVHPVDADQAFRIAARFNQLYTIGTGKTS